MTVIYGKAQVDNPENFKVNKKVYLKKVKSGQYCCISEKEVCYFLKNNKDCYDYPCWKLIYIEVKNSSIL